MVQQNVISDELQGTPVSTLIQYEQWSFKRNLFFSES